MLWRLGVTNCEQRGSDGCEYHDGDDDDDDDDDDDYNDYDCHSHDDAAASGNRCVV